MNYLISQNDYIYNTKNKISTLIASEPGPDLNKRSKIRWDVILVIFLILFLSYVIMESRIVSEIISSVCKASPLVIIFTFGDQQIRMRRVEADVMFAGK